jgi:hypothetical protein
MDACSSDRTGLDWTGKYPTVIAALANLNVRTDHFHGALFGFDAPTAVSRSGRNAVAESFRGHAVRRTDA